MAFTIRPVEYYYTNVRDELGAAYSVLSQLEMRGSGVTDAAGSFGYVVYVREDQFERAVRALQL